MGGSGKRMGGLLGKGMVVGLAAAGAAVVAVGASFASGLKAAMESEQITAQTEAVLKSTGNAAGVTGKQVQDLANTISAYSGKSDESVREAQNMLLTFKQVRNETGKGNDVFTQATKSIADMSTALGTDMKASSLQVGKALNDPIKGTAMLGRAGVQFTQGQKDQIKAMQESGNLMGAQKIVLKELEGQFGGSAKAAGDTFAGSMEKVKNAFGDTIRDAVAPMLPKLTEMATIMAAKLPGAINAVINAGKAMAAMFSPIVARVRELIAGFGGSGGGGLSAALAAVKAVIVTSILPVVQQMVTTFTTTFLPAIMSVVSYVGTSLVPVFQQIWTIISTRVLPIFKMVGTFIYGTLVPAIAKIAVQVGGSLKPVFDQLVTTFKTQVLPTLNVLLAKFQEWWPTIKKVITIVVKVIGAVLRLAAAILGKVLPPIIKMVGFVVGKVVPSFISLVSAGMKVAAFFIRLGSSAISAGKKIAEFVKDVISKVTGMKDKVVGALKDAGEWLKEAGKDIVRGLGEGIESMKQWVKDKVEALAGFVPGWVKKKLGIASPSKVMAKLGVEIPNGLAKGIDKGAPKAIKAVKSMADNAIKAVKAKIDAFKSLRDSIKGVFAPDLFGASPADFLGGLKTQLANNNVVIAALKKLRGMNLNPAFLSGLISSGNTGLITALAGASQGTVKGAQSDWLAVQSTAGQIGSNTATDVVGKGLSSLEAELKKLNKAVKYLAKETGREVARGVNDSASKGKRNSKRGG
jgi:phage-related protein